ncbi:hypothetical protein BKA62DRAFT_237969 [Auriculariales sp. MPI-PUGE-AT-0066]|nr:hypothetical protein BKA62DRAFT_237969 [Auriculariales sp. MPI-PUGE-AT-0066]
MARDRDNDLDSDDSGLDLDEPSGKPGRKKNPNSQAARRDQNRIAQREFRLRKQQRIRELEARVEILSGTQDETFNYMRAIVKDLITENASLRSLVKNLGQAVGEGLPGFLPRMGWDGGEFNDFLNKSENDTALESFARLKRQAVSHTISSQKRSLDDDGPDGSNKRARFTRAGYQGTPGSPDLEMLTRSAAANVATTNGNGTSSDMFSANPDPMSFTALFDVPYTSQSPVGMQQMGQQHSPAFPIASGSASSQREMFAGGLPAMDLRPRSRVAGLPPLESTSLGLTSAPAVPQDSITTPTRQFSDSSSVQEENPRIQEAFKMIHYHLDNYRRNPQYHLPPSLRPSLIQRTIPHDTVIDGIPLPELRDRMILFKGRYDLAACVFSFGTMSKVHGTDVLSMNNWELGRPWLTQYGFLVDQSILNITNRWRKERGEPEINLAELGIAEPVAGDS